MVLINLCITSGTSPVFRVASSQQSIQLTNNIAYPFSERLIKITVKFLNEKELYLQYW